MAMAGTANAGFSAETDGGYEFSVNGFVPVFAIWNSPDASGQDDNFSVTTGFNPATMNLNVAAPTSNGLDVSAHLSLNNHIGSGGTAAQNGGGVSNGGLEGRVAKFVVSGDFGTLDIGKGFGIIGTPAIGDAGSAKGVGLHGVPTGGNATAGHITTGYTYANFNPRVIYRSNDLGGFKFNVGAFNPSRPGAGYNVDTPRLEGNVIFGTDMFSVWVSGGTQSVNAATGSGNNDYTMSAVDVGGSLSVGGFGLRANYSQSSGWGTGPFAGGLVWAAGPDEQETDYDQYYVEGTFTSGPATVGLSYGVGDPEAPGVNADTQHELAMLFGRYAVTPQWDLLAEYQDRSVDQALRNPGSFGQTEYSAFILGSQFTF